MNLYRSVAAGVFPEVVLLAAVRAGIPESVAGQLRFGIAQIAGPEPEVNFPFSAPTHVVRAKTTWDGSQVASASLASRGEIDEARRVAEIAAQDADPNYQIWKDLVARDRQAVEDHPVTAWLRSQEGLAWRRADTSDTDAAYYRTGLTDALRLATWLVEYVVAG